MKIVCPALKTRSRIMCDSLYKHSARLCDDDDDDDDDNDNDMMTMIFTHWINFMTSKHCSRRQLTRNETIISSFMNKHYKYTKLLELSTRETYAVNEVIDGVGKLSNNLQQTWKQKPSFTAATLHCFNQRCHNDTWEFRQ